MPKITIDLPEEVNKQLKILALQDDRSLAKCIARFLAKCVADKNITDAYINNTPITVTAFSTSTFNNFKNNNIDLQQLQDMGVKDIRFNKPGRELTPEEQILQEQKVQQQLSNLKQKRIKFLKDQCQNILGDLMPYLEDNDQHTIDLVLEKYPTDEDIVRYLNEIKEENDNYVPPEEEAYLYEEEINQFESLLPHPLDPYYEKIKQFCIDNGYTEDLYQMLQYPDYDSWTHEQETIICSALDISKPDHLSEKDWREIASYFKNNK